MNGPLARDPGRVPAWRLLARFVGMDLRLLRARLVRRMCRRELLPLPAGVPPMPDSTICRDALALATAACPPVVLSHVRRSHAFGAMLAARGGVRLDPEVFWVAAVLHDLGLGPELADADGSFEWVGAARARRFSLEHGLGTARADLVHEAVALHSAVGLAHRREPEVAMVHYGAGVDVIGIRLDEIPPAAVRAVLEECPRLEFKRCFGALIEGQAARKPGSHIAGHVGLGFIGRMRAAPFAD